MAVTDLKSSDICVVVPTLNEARHIEACLTSLMRGDALLSEVEFIVADGGSDDGTVDIVRNFSSEHPNVRLVHNPQKIQSIAVNLGARVASPKARILVRCDAHSIYPDNYVVDLARKLDETGAASVVVPMDAVGEGCFQRANAFIVDSPLGNGGSAHRGGLKSGYVDHGHHAAFNMSAFKALGGYDETFTHNEDAEYDHRVNASGGKVFLDADTRISYYPRDTFQALWKQYFNYGKGRARNMKKHRSKPKLRQFVPVLNLFAMIGGFVFAAFCATLIPEDMSLLATLGIAMGLLPSILYFTVLGLVSIWAVQKLQSACGIHAAGVLFCMHNSWALGFVKTMLFAERPANEPAIALNTQTEI